MNLTYQNPKNEEEQEVFTEEELHVANVVYDGNFGYRAGGFTCALIEAIFRATGDNFSKLQSQWPDLVKAVTAWKSGDLSDRVNKVSSGKWKLV